MMMSTRLTVGNCQFEKGSARLAGIAEEPPPFKLRVQYIAVLSA